MGLLGQGMNKGYKCAFSGWYPVEQAFSGRYPVQHAFSKVCLLRRALFTLRALLLHIPCPVRTHMLTYVYPHVGLFPFHMRLFHKTQPHALLPLVEELREEGCPPRLRPNWACTLTRCRCWWSTGTSSLCSGYSICAWSRRKCTQWRRPPG